MLAFVRNNTVRTTVVSRPGSEDAVESPATKRRKIDHIGDTATGMETSRKTRSQGRRLENNTKSEYEPVVIPDSADEEDGEKEDEEYQPGMSLRLV